MSELGSLSVATYAQSAAGLADSFRTIPATDSDNVEKVAAFSSESVAAFRRNGWPPSIGIGGRIGAENAAEKDRVHFGSKRRRSWRNVVGKRGASHWHFALSARPTFDRVRRFTLFPHVLFSDDGFRFWESDARLQRARAGLTRTWWNPEWRDRLLGTVSFLGPNGSIALKVGPNEQVTVSSHLEQFESPISYLDPGSEPFDTGDDIHADDDEDAPQD